MMRRSLCDEIELLIAGCLMSLNYNRISTSRDLRIAAVAAACENAGAEAAAAEARERGEHGEQGVAGGKRWHGLVCQELEEF